MYVLLMHLQWHLDVADSAEFREICEMAAWEHARYYEADTFQSIKLSPGPNVLLPIFNLFFYYHILTFSPAHRKLEEPHMPAYASYKTHAQTLLD